METSPSVRPPLQRRSRKTLDRIVRATLEVLEEEGAQGVTVQEIVRRSGTSVGSFYHRFSSKDDLLAYVEARIWEDAEERWTSVWNEVERAGGRLEDVAQRAVEALVEAYRSGVRVAEALAPPGAPTGTEGAEGTQGARTFQDRVRRDLAEAFLARSGELRHPDPELGIDLAFHLVMGALREIGGLRGRAVGGSGPVLDDGLVVRELTRILIGYLGPPAEWGKPGSRGSPPGAPGEGGVDPFEVWS